MSTLDIQLTNEGRTLGLPGIPAGTTVHIHLHNVGPRSSAEAAVVAPETAPKRLPSAGRWMPVFLLLAGVVGGSALMSATSGGSRPAQAFQHDAAVGHLPSPASSELDGQERAELETLGRQLRQTPSVTPPAGQASPASASAAPHPFGLEN